MTGNERHVLDEADQTTTAPSPNSDITSVADYDQAHRQANVIPRLS